MSDVSDAAPRILRQIQQTLVEIRSTADVDRRNNRSLYDNLTFEMGRQFGALDAKLELVAERLEDVFDRQEEHAKALARIEALLQSREAP